MMDVCSYITHRDFVSGVAKPSINCIGYFTKLLQVCNWG